MKLANWTVLKDGGNGRTIEPILFTGDSEEFSLKITDKDLVGAKDDNGDNQFSKVMDFCLHRFDHNVLVNGVFCPKRPPLGLWEWQANCMGNYMMYLIEHHGFNSKYYCPRNPVKSLSILPHPVCCLYSIKMANILCGNRFICDTYSITEYFDTVSPVKENMPQDILKDLI